MYLSTTDYMQHKAAPGSEIANRFYAMLDRYVGELEAAAACSLTADHGMNDKHRPTASRTSSTCRSCSTSGSGRAAARILPITDPYVVHTGALGSFATVYLPQGRTAPFVERLARSTASICGRRRRRPAAASSCRRTAIGDVVVLSAKHKVLGTAPDRHDLSGLTEPLRSHGGLTEQTVPMIVNRRIAVPPGRTLRNFDAFDVALNLVAVP
jgi:phosphonoacetate hydrolase